MNQDLKNKLKALFSPQKRTVLLTAAGILGILLILLSEAVPAGRGNAPSETQERDDAAYAAQYAAALEEELTDVLSRIEGVGDVNVSLTLETGVSYEYATEGRSAADADYSSDGQYATQTSSETSVILVERDGAKEPLVLRRTEPTVQGVAVVCGGGGDPAVKEEVTRVVCVLCGVRSNRVSVSKTP